MVMFGEMIENAIRSEKIDVGESVKKSTLRKKDNEVNVVSIYNMNYSKLVTITQPRTMMANHPGPLKQESSLRPNTERVQFTPIPMTYDELYQKLKP